MVLFPVDVPTPVRSVPQEVRGRKAPHFNMPVDVKLDRCEENDPRRCKGVGAHGQCPYLAADDSSYCLRHGGNKAQESKERLSIRQYRLAKWRDAVDHYAGHEKLKDLSEEVGILRVILEETLNKCNSSDELLMNSNRISDLILKIEKVVGTLHRLQQATGQLLDKTAALNFAMQIVNIVGEHVKDPLVIDAISEKMLKSLTSLTSIVSEVPTAKGA